ncbi:hypothetical protein B5807_07903 [Epicoccum nigrum]|uniref:Uncharacterized protein n=1 Tax=Epicoccum nigrum TaxID=105696 RepID=A0A1Y2LWL9_EPING|nr:hypothetical protein B5807_07903 [Epicoccum nigrum]
MAGYGNRTAPDISPSSHDHDHASTRLGLTDTHDPPTYAGGAGLGNKLSQTTSSSSHTADTAHGTDEPLRFDSQARHGSAPYSNAHVYGSACTAGAGWGNKTGSFSDEGHGEGGRGSTLGRLVEKVGGVVGKGRGMREGKGEGEGGAADGMVAN